MNPKNRVETPFQRLTAASLDYFRTVIPELRGDDRAIAMTTLSQGGRLIIAVNSTRDGTSVNHRVRTE